MVENRSRNAVLTSSWSLTFFLSFFTTSSSGYQPFYRYEMGFMRGVQMRVAVVLCFNHHATRGNAVEHFIQFRNALANISFDRISMVEAMKRNLNLILHLHATYASPANRIVQLARHKKPAHLPLEPRDRAPTAFRRRLALCAHYTLNYTQIMGRADSVGN